MVGMARSAKLRRHELWSTFKDRLGSSLQKHHGDTSLVLKAGIMQGLALEVGLGPGYLGLEWLKKTEGTRLKALEISPDMITIAERNAKEYGPSR